MVKTSLVEQDLRDGKKLVEALEAPQASQPSFRLKAALWLYETESMEWRLVLATPLVDEEGPLATYSYLQRILSAIQPVDLSVENISVVSPRDPLIRAFKGVLRIGPDSAGMRFTRGVVRGTYIEDAYVYRVS